MRNVYVLELSVLARMLSKHFPPRVLEGEKGTTDRGATATKRRAIGKAASQRQS